MKTKQNKMKFDWNLKMRQWKRFEERKAKKILTANCIKNNDKNDIAYLYRKKKLFYIFISNLSIVSCIGHQARPIE